MDSPCLGVEPGILGHPFGIPADDFHATSSDLKISEKDERSIHFTRDFGYLCLFLMCCL